VDLDLRKVRYFVVLAEELNYRRAAERLHVAQPVLTRQIRSLERDLTAQLFERGRAGTRLTDAGRQLLTDAQGLLADAQATRRRVARLGGTIRTFTIGFRDPGSSRARVRLDRPATEALLLTITNKSDIQWTDLRTTCGRNKSSLRLIRNVSRGVGHEHANTCHLPHDGRGNRGRLCPHHSRGGGK
jgi:hypothetical protein